MSRHRSVCDRTAIFMLATVLIGPVLGTACGRRSTSSDATSASLPVATSETVGPGSSATSSVVATTAVVTSTTDPVSEVATITANWERFFLPTTSIADRVALLENGPSLQQALEVRSKDPLQLQASAKVKKVELLSGDRASVTYDVLLNGTVALADGQGFAVRQDGVWKVTAESFCALISLGATAPIPGCG